MRTKSLGWAAGLVLLVAPGGAGRADEGGGYEALLKALPGARHTLVQGIEQAGAKAPEAALSAKFELDDHGKLSLSVYTAEKGLAADAEHNVLKELSGDPAAAQWAPEVEVFKDTEHLTRSATQLTLLRLSAVSLAEIVRRAEKEHPGQVFSVTPVMGKVRPEFLVLVAAAGGRVAEVRYDLVSGADIATAVRAAAAKDCGCKTCAARGCEPCHGKNCYYCAAKALAVQDCGCHDCAAMGCASCGPGCDVCKFHLAPVEEAGKAAAPAK